jgi:hypothetical protein
MATPKLKLVPPKREEQPYRNSTESQGFYAPWRQEFWKVSQLGSTLTGLLLGTLLLGGFLYAYNLIQQITSGKTIPQSAESSMQEYVVTTSAYIHSEPSVSKNSRIGVCEQGARLQVVGTQVAEGRVWYEIKILSQHAKSLDSANRMWVAADCVTMLRK